LIFTAETLIHSVITLDFISSYYRCPIVAFRFFVIRLWRLMVLLLLLLLLLMQNAASATTGGRVVAFFTVPLVEGRGGRISVDGTYYYVSTQDHSRNKPLIIHQSLYNM